MNAKRIELSEEMKMENPVGVFDEEQMAIQREEALPKSDRREVTVPCKKEAEEQGQPDKQTKLAFSVDLVRESLVLERECVCEASQC